ncbi:hypothetical protein DV702_10640 [Sporosarcina sp. PTS2304]|uniref:hypothetical protein n=1 Tax=Sporosarcina sp. PTS2304 TaxID=2283194 RepID=UPI000E0DA531|nr:hypothetical protein [Sporosarcina sp. PTS2304]AXI00134.1 hypothetical protein DV702_10640 [Sporosarcina sp. PTS2304]
MKDKPKSRFYIKVLIWFIFLSTFGVGGGIFFLLFAVVPIEQMYTDRGWSQFKIDTVMKYFVVGWVAFGFVVSFLYYFIVVKRNRWRLTWTIVACSLFLCLAGLYYFMNTGSGLVQSSQGEVVEGDRFTFGPYPEKEDLVQLKAQGYDGVITLLSPTLPIEKPLLDQEIRSAEEVGLDVHSLPMLPWVGDNSKSIERVRELIKEDKKYYVHCYLGRHRVDVIKQVVNEETGDEQYQLRFLQPTTLERGSLFYFPDQSIVMGPFPTEEEWFTRIKRGEVEEVVSLLKDPQDSEWPLKEKKIVAELQMTYTSMPIVEEPSIREIRKIAEYLQSLDHKVYVHDFSNSPALMMLETYLDWGTTLTGAVPPELQCGKSEWVGRKMLVGCQPTKEESDRLRELGITDFVDMDELSLDEQYLSIKESKENKSLTYLVTAKKSKQVKRVAIGLLYGSDTRGKEFDDIAFSLGKVKRHERNLLVGPMLEPKEYSTFAKTYGVSQLFYLRSISTSSDEELSVIEKLAAENHISLVVIPMISQYEELLIPLIDKESGLNYIMVESSLIPEVNDYLKKF